MTTALEKVRVAHALKTLPALSRAFATGELPIDTGELVGKALDKARDEEAVGGRGGRAALPIESVKRLCCDSHAVVITEDKNGVPLNVGRKTRIVPTAIQRAVRARDNGCCTFPGCRNHRYLHSHHVEHWSNGGETSLDNLMLLCTKHHTLNVIARRRSRRSNLFKTAAYRLLRCARNDTWEVFTQPRPAPAARPVIDSGAGDDPFRTAKVATVSGHCELISDRFPGI